MTAAKTLSMAHASINLSLEEVLSTENTHVGTVDCASHYRWAQHAHAAVVLINSEKVMSGTLSNNL